MIMETHILPGVYLRDGQYKVERVLGQGGFGITYLAVQESLGRRVAIKEFYMKELCSRDNGLTVSVPSLGSRETVARYKNKFINEARKIARLKHENIVPVIDVFEENETAYYVMSYYSGSSLAELVCCGPIEEALAVKYVKQVASALAYIHERQMMHLDVKPANILLDENNNAVLIDFGLAKQYDSSGQETSTTPVGISVGYAPKEQYRIGGVGRFLPATDIYSLGATLYKLLTGVTPPEANDVDDYGLPALPEHVSLPVRNAVVAAMQPRSTDRPQSISEFLAMIDGCSDGDTSLYKNDEEDASNGDTVMAAEKKTGSGKNWYTVIFALLLFVLLAFVIINFMDEPAREEVYSFVNNSDSVPVCYSKEVEIPAEEVAVEVVKKYDIEYFGKKSSDYEDFPGVGFQELYANVDGKKYRIDIDDMCFDVFAQDDFNGDGIPDALIRNIQACGGNAIGNSYFFVTYNDSGYFTVTNSFGDNVWEEPVIEEWNGKKTVVIIDTNSGFNREDYKETRKRYAFNGNEAQLLESGNKSSLVALQEVVPSDFHDGKEENTICLYFDLDENGRDDVIECTYWARWNSVNYCVYVNGGKEPVLDGADSRIGIDSNKTNGFHNLISGKDAVCKWNGVKYVFPD